MNTVFLSGRFLISLAAALRRSDGPPGRKLSLNELFLSLTKKVLDLGILSFSIDSIIAYLCYLGEPLLVGLPVEG